MLLSAEIVIKAIIEILIILVLSYGVYREKSLIRFEQKIAKYIKAFFKAVYYSIKDLVEKASAPQSETDEQKQARFDSGAEAGNELYKK